MTRKQQRKGLRQGDILIVPREGAAFEGQKVPPVKGRQIIAEGEATGHHHAVAATPNVLLMDDGIDTVISVSEKPVSLTHEEHRALSIPVGESDVIRQRRIVPGSEHVVRTVVD